ncbi:hypothetical protein ACI7RC_14575 [Brevibacillus sp. B_LB10_24]|uniref:hypothetical protein n=1 Tax=Brevibacillus sp. B_LB10_24 TaxID=3380645 RepID=UPI0038BC9A1C
MTDKNAPSPIAKEELETLGTHATGSPDQYKTRKTDEVQTIEPPDHPGGAGSSGVY